MTDWSENKSISMLRKAKEGGYAVLAQVCYDTSSCLAVIRAAERTRSPAMILLFPATLRQFGKPFLKFILDAARSATVPIAVHLDHATTAEDIDLVLTWAEQSSEKEREACFDSIMIDASHAPSDEENLSLVIPHIQRATACRIPVEVELGRLEGGEAGLRVIESGGQELTDPKRAERFMNESGAVVLAPSIGNLHGKYLREPDFRLDILNELNTITSKNGHYLCLHGTDQLSDQLFRQCIDAGTVKINVNSWAREPYLARFAQGVQKEEPLPEIIEAATEAFTGSCERMMRLFGSAGKA